MSIDDMDRFKEKGMMKKDHLQKILGMIGQITIFPRP